MNRYTIRLALPLLILLLHTVQPCFGQAGGQRSVATARDAEAKYDAPENDMGLVHSEWAFRLNATHKAMPEFPEEALKERAQGTVILSLYQDGEGNAAQIKVLESRTRRSRRRRSRR